MHHRRRCDDAAPQRRCRRLNSLRRLAEGQGDLALDRGEMGTECWLWIYGFGMIGVELNREPIGGCVFGAVRTAEPVTVV